MPTQGRPPIVPPPSPNGLNSALERNIEVLRARRARDEQNAARDERIAGAISGFAGSMTFVYLHAMLFGSWIVINLGWVPGLTPWDPTFVVLGMIASVEAIFLSTFVLINQNRMAASADKRADLDLQISLLTEHELTKVVVLVAEIARKHGIKTAEDGEIEELKSNVAPEAVLDKIEQADAG
jgi:uncharacterized membrane protein